MGGGPAPPRGGAEAPRAGARRGEGRLTELRLLATFEKVATALSSTRAAAELAYAQSSVTSRIRALESSLGTKLLRARL
ncbi:LysR family transcriptional regulator [Streptomyces sp. NPDC056632]|uniref:LysR family transcriptional regulator n=1 Tax=Streptomyces sp. NPDC056632 TaxID=3345884 RepID=UPI0036752500